MTHKIQPNDEPFIIERIYNAPIAKVWQAITNKEAMKEWYFDLDAFKPEVGFEFSFSGKGTKGEHYLHLCKIIEIVPGKKISYSWKYDKYEGSSIVTFELFAEGEKTKLKLTHAGLETFPDNNDDFAKESFATGWTYLIGKALEEFVEN